MTLSLILHAAITAPYFISPTMGCYNDFVGGWRMLPMLLSSSGYNGVGVNSTCMSVKLCGYIARSAAFTYFGVEAGTCARGGRDNIV